MLNSIKNPDALAKQFNSSAYELLEKIGEGGFGCVYRAKQLNTGQSVAIKFLSISAEFDDAKKQRYIERFQRETQLVGRLQHPNIVRLLDKVHCGELLYAVFEYVDGKTLKQTLIESGALSPVETVEVMSQVLDALAHAHKQGVIHRDIKPANIMLTKSGAKTHAKVLDFGIGTLISEARQLDYKSITLTQETLGTPSYSAPEQLRGEPPTLKTDLYVWGLVFIECLTGQPAITGSNLASIFHKQLSQENVPLPAAIVGHPIAALLRRVLQKKAHERSVNAAALYKDLIHINLSNLVGELVSRKEQNRLSDRKLLPMDCDETLINNNAIYYTGLTERKQITALSIFLSARSVTDNPIDHEVVDALHRDQKNQCLDTAIRYGACHVGSLGDSLLFYFGYPMVSDNDVRLCARTALDIISNLNKRNALLRTSQGIEMEIRIGMHTGLVTSYADATPEGDTPNIAMQLARMADSEQILCSDVSRDLLKSYIEFEPAQACMLGVDRVETQLFSLLAERQVEAFGFLRSSQKNYAFIGREQELEQLSELLNDSEQNTTNLVHVCGEAGIGKSRLVFELRHTALKMRHHIAQCLPEHKNNALYPILKILKYRYSLNDIAPQVALQRLTQAMQTVELRTLENNTLEEKNQGFSVLCSWLNLPLDGSLPLSDMVPEVQNKLLFSTLIALLADEKISDGQCDLESAVKQRNLFIFEDLHWADPTSLEFIAEFVTVLKFTSDVVISTSRKALPVSLEQLGFDSITLHKLTTAATAKFILALFDDETVSENVLDVLIARTDGIPLFIEELANMLKQKELVHKLNGVIDFVNPDKLDKVPNSLRDSLQQKLDGLLYAKETAQLAATIGREFDYELLVAASHYGESQVQNDLNELLDAEIIYLQRKVAGDSYIFKHALVKDAAYDSQTQSATLESHKKIVYILEQGQSEIIKKTPLIYIDHLFDSGNAVKAFEQSVNIGTALSIDGHFIYAMNMIEHSLNNLHRIVEDDRPTCEADLRLTYSMLLMTVKGFGSEDYKRNIAKIDKLPLEKLDSERQCSIYFSLMINYAVLTQLPQGLMKYNELDKLVTIPEHFMALIHFVNALILHSSGDAPQAYQEYSLAKYKYNQVSESNLVACKDNYRRHVPYDLLSALHSHHALALLERDELDSSNLILAKQELDLAYDAANDSQDPHTLAFFYFHRAQFAYYMKDFKSMKKYALRSQEIASKNNIVTWKSMSTFLLGWVLVNVEGKQHGLELMDAGYIEWSSAGAISHRAWMQALMAQSYAKLDQREQSTTLMTSALAQLECDGEKRFAFDILAIQKSLSDPLF